MTQPRYPLSISLTPDQFEQSHKLRNELHINHKDIYLAGMSLLEHRIKVSIDNEKVQ